MILRKNDIYIKILFYAFMIKISISIRSLIFVVVAYKAEKSKNKNLSDIDYLIAALDEFVVVPNSNWLLYLRFVFSMAYRTFHQE